VSTNPPTGEPEQRWQQPSFGPSPDEPVQPTYYPTGMVPAHSGPLQRVPPPSTLENVVSALAKVIWPVAIALFIFTKAGFFPLLIFVLVAGAVLRAIKKSLRQRRYALPQEPTTDSDPQR